MTRMMFASALVILAGATASARAPQTPPAGQTPPPAQTPKPPPALPTGQAAPTPAPVLPFPADSKFAFINMQALLSETKLGKAGLTQMKALTDKQQADLTEKNNAINALNQKIQQQGAVVTPSALAQMNADLEKAQRDMQYARNEAQAQGEELNQRLLTDFQDKVLPIINEFAKEKGLYGVFSVQDSGVAYWNSALDVTAEISKRIDTKFPGGK
jgi:outer membrane protein